LNPNDWAVVLPHPTRGAQVAERKYDDNGVVFLMNGGGLRTRYGFTHTAEQPVWIAGKWTFVPCQSECTDSIRVVTRSNGYLTSSGFPGEGIEFSFYNNGEIEIIGYGKYEVLNIQTGGEIVVPDGSAWPPVHFEVVDDGESVAFLVTSDNSTIWINGTSDYNSTSEFVLFHNSPAVGGARVISALDDVIIQSGRDCEGTFLGVKTIDHCGVCGGDDSTCCYNYLEIEDPLWDYILIPEAVSDLIERFERTYSVLDWELANLVEFSDIPTDWYPTIAMMAEINRIFLTDCSLLQFCADSGSFWTILSGATERFNPENLALNHFET